MDLVEALAGGLSFWSFSSAAADAAVATEAAAAAAAVAAAVAAVVAAAVAVAAAPAAVAAAATRVDAPASFSIIPIISKEALSVRKGPPSFFKKHGPDLLSVF